MERALAASTGRRQPRQMLARRPGEEAAANGQCDNLCHIVGGRCTTRSVNARKVGGRARRTAFGSQMLYK
jgi:hypothetical protein